MNAHRPNRLLRRVKQLYLNHNKPYLAHKMSFFHIMVDRNFKNIKKYGSEKACFCDPDFSTQNCDVMEICMSRFEISV
jgi:hypothetical protein